MPYLKPQTKKILTKQRVAALKGCKSNKEFGYKVARIGSKGGTDLDHSAEETGRQILASLATDLLAKLDEGEVKFSERVVSILKDASLGNIEKGFKFEQMKWAAEQGLKAGVLGGYAPEKKQSVNLNINASAHSKEARQLASEYEKRLRESLKDEKEDTGV